MFKWIRWPGLIAFLAITGGLLAFFILLAPVLTKTAIQSVGTAMNGAKVEVDSVRLSFNPLGMSIYNLQVTDARQPMKNAVQFKKAVAELELAPLFAGRGIIRELSLDGLEFGTDRAYSGEIKKVKKSKDEPSKLQELAESVDLPDIKEILAKEPLRTEKAGENLKAGYKHSKDDVEQRLAAVPDDQALKDYEARLKAITSGDLKSLEDFRERKQQLDALKEQFKADQQAVEAARKAVSNAKSTITANVTALKNAPGEDVAYLRDKYQLNAQGATNVTALLFGQDAANWASQALYWYEIIKPYLASDGEDEVVKVKEEPRIRDGRYIHFPAKDPWPSFLIRKIRGTASLAWGELKISGEDITHEPKVLGRPMHLAANGANLSNIEQLGLDLILDHRQSPGTDQLNLTVKDWQPSAMKLGVAGAELSSSRTQIQSIAMVSGGRLSASGKATFTQAKFTGQGKSTFERELVAALSGIKSFTIDGEAEGRLIAPKVKMGSDLDKQLSHAFSQRINEKQKEFEAQLKAELNTKLEGYLGEHSSILDELNQTEGGLNAKLDKLKNLASAELADFEQQQKQKAKEKADAEKEAAKSKAKDEAKDKLNKLF